MDTKRGKRRGGGGGGVMNWAIGMDMETLMCIKWMTNKEKYKLKKRENYTIGISLFSKSYTWGSFLNKESDQNKNSNRNS